MSEMEILYLEEVHSTNSFLRERLQQEEFGDLYTVYTGFQNMGRGQRGNLWESERGKNLTFSTLIFPKGLDAAKQFILSQAVSLSIKEVLDRECEGICIKWPNDIYWKEKKIAGILIENDVMDGCVFRSIVGVGLNLNQEFFRSDAPNPVSLRQITGREYLIKEVLRDLLNSLQYYLALSVENPLSVQFQYRDALFRKRGTHLFEDAEGTFEAEIADVEPSGLLVLKTTGGSIRKYAFKEVSYIL